MPEKPDIADIRAAFHAADDEVFRTLQANNYAMTDGSYSRALRVADECKAALDAALQKAGGRHE